jgi:two-component system, OmpR family, phosphate regulon sensor histidine kinase PhoR
MPDRYSGEFLRDMIHDIINPLSSLVGFLDMLLSPGAKDPLTQRQKRMLVTMDRACTHFLGMMRDISDLSRIQDEGWTPSRDKADLRRAAEKTISDYQLLADGRRISMALDGPPDVSVSGDERMMERFFDALLRTAGRLTEEDGKILLHLTAEDRGVSGSLEHTGESLPLDTWAEAFTASLGGPRPSGGYSMMGATLAKLIARLHGGDLEAAPRPGGGTVFRFRFPQ